MKKSTPTTIGLTLFIFIICFDSLGILLEDMTWRYIFKPLITPTLLATYLVSTKRIDNLYVGALIFAWVADALLLNSSNGYFVMALGFFLLMHLTYIMILTDTMRRYNTRNLLLAAVPFFAVLVFVISFVSNNINDFLWPILVYGIVVCIFSALAFYNYLEKRTHPSLMLLLGSFFFIISNSMSAIEKFRLENRDLAVGIMVTYALAQYLIYKYMIRQADIYLEKSN